MTDRHIAAAANAKEQHSENSAYGRQPADTVQQASHTLQTKAEQQLPLGVRIAAAWSWRLIIIGVAIASAIWLISKISTIIVPLLLAILLAALLQPIVLFIERAGLPKWLGVITALATLFTAVTVLVFLIITQFREGIDGIAFKAQNGFNKLIFWLQTGPLELNLDNIHFSFDEIMHALQDNQSRIWTGAMGVASSATAFFAGTLLTLFALIFFLFDGKRIWYWVLGFMPANAHAPVDAAAKAGWISVGQYVRVQILVAFIDAVGIGIGAWALKVPFAVPIAILVFLGSFIPFLGAITTGAIACLIALIYNDWQTALIMLAIVLLVNQLEGQILQPLVMGNAVRVHPLGVVLAVTMGGMLAGIPGALFAVPIAASANSMVNTLVEGKWRGNADPLVAYHRSNNSKRKAKMRLKTLAKLKRAGKAKIDQ